MEARNHLLKGNCYLCLGSSYSLLCEACTKDIFNIQIPRCLACAAHLVNSNICSHCQKNAFFFKKTKVLCDYQYPVDRLIRAIKFKKDPELLPFFADRFVENLVKRNELPQILIPVPLHPRRQRERGFNQSLILAKLIGKRLDIPVKSRFFTRTRHTEPQSLLTPKKRKGNLINAFKLNKQPRNYHHAAIIDDVITSGATVNELAKLLTKTGVTQIEVWAIAKALR